MKNRLLPLIFAFLAVTSVNAQKCGTYDGAYEEQEQKFPAFYQNLEAINSDLEADYKSALGKMTHLKIENGKKIIPVVVHVIHDLGGENISDASIQGALDILNANINGQASNFLAKTPDIFASVRGDLNVEFRLAKIDPLGNPTSGIVRVRSELTNEPEPRDAVKALSYWNSYQYFNIWTLKKFQPQDDGNTLLGYAQFPNSGRMSTDGVVLLASQMVSGGTLTHECGHWLGLRHVWGDAQCGDDNVKDTPAAREPNFGINLSDFPYHVGFMSQGCVADSLNPAGEMFVNYMDYSSDAHVTMFTKGQNEVMNETLEGLYDEDAGVSGIGFREYMWSVDNIALSGVADGFITPICNQNTDFVSSSGKYSMCLGENIVLKGNKTQFPSGTVSSMIWDYGDGNTDNSNANLVAHTYSSAGSYNLSLTIEYNETTEARASNLSDLDLLNATSYDSIIETLIIQGTESELIAAGASNISLHLDDDGYSVNSYWENGVYYPDTLFYRGDLEQITYIAYYINSCSSTTLKENFITISPTSSSNTAGTYVYDFEDASELSADWQVTKAVSIGDWSFNSIENSSWDWINGVAVSGSAGLMINKNNLTLGEADELISVAYDLSALTSPAIKFSWSGASLNTFPVNEVNIYFSYDCGGVWRTLGSLTNVQVASAGIYITNFKPTTDEWNDTVMTNNQLKNDNIKFKFEYVTNGIANNFYLDNIEIGEAATLMLPNSTIASRVSIYPNPTDGKTLIELNNLANKQIEVKLVNILGAEIMHLFSGEIVSNSYMINNIDLSHLETGIYFVKVVADGDIVMTDKLILK
ncbi:zinc-dependent metalloprotease [Flavobacteriales bacterium]|nr:zinc-dependent metalloprotease [Flavobacteriales bacterium]